MLVEISSIKGRPIWFFTPYEFVMNIDLFTNLEKDLIYSSSDLILADKELIENEIIKQFKEINIEIISKKNDSLVFEIDSFNLNLFSIH